VNPNLRKVALIAASLGLLLSLFIALRPGDEEAAPTTTMATTTAPTTMETQPPATTTEPPTTEGATTAPKPPDVVTIRIGIPSDTVPKVRRYSVKQGRKVVIVVRTELSDHVHLHGYDLMADVGPGQPGTIRFTATAPGRFEVELEDRGLEFAELEVRP
jgi:hypothetical protein